MVNEVLSLPFSFSDVVEPTATVSTRISEIVEPTATVSTQTDDMDFGRIYEEIFPYVACSIFFGVFRVLWRLRATLPVIGDSMSWGEEATSADSDPCVALS